MVINSFTLLLTEVTLKLVWKVHVSEYYPIFSLERLYPQANDLRLKLLNFQSLRFILRFHLISILPDGIKLQAIWIELT